MNKNKILKRSLVDILEKKNQNNNLEAPPKGSKW